MATDRRGLASGGRQTRQIGPPDPHLHTARLGQASAFDAMHLPRLAQVALERVIRYLIEQDAETHPPATDVPSV